MDALDALIARDEIRQLAFRYAVAVDGKDLDAVAVLFVPDVDNGRFGPGREGVRRYYDTSLRNFHCSMHLVANHVIDLRRRRPRDRHRLLRRPPPRAGARPLVRRGPRLLGLVPARRRRMALPAEAAASWFRRDIDHPDQGTARVGRRRVTSGKRGARACPRSTRRSRPSGPLATDRRPERHGDRRSDPPHRRVRARPSWCRELRLRLSGRLRPYGAWTTS